MKEYPDKYFELAIVDPPYGIGASKGTWGSSNVGKVTNYGKKSWDHQTPDSEYFIELIRVSKNQIVWGANHFGNFPPAPCWIVWDKVKTGEFADCELAWTSFDSTVRKFAFMWNGMMQGSNANGSEFVGDLSKKEIRIHPTQKPVQLYKWLLKNYAKEGDKILDTHLGSGSSRIAAFDGGFEFVGYELDKDYFEAAEKRFAQHKSQLKLFV